LGREVAIYLHIPKTGGMGMTDALKKAYPGGVQVFPNFVIDAEIKLETRIVLGHLQFGCHKDIFPIGLRWRYLTMLRDPTERFFSHWAYLKRQGRMELDLIELLQSRKAIADNMQVRMLVGKPWAEWSPVGQPVTEKDFKQATYNLAQYFDWVGVLEQHGRSVDHLSEILGADLEKINTNRWTHRRELTVRERAAIEKRHRWDRYLYNWARGAYDYH